MQPLSNVCETFVSSQYRYVICPYQYVNQIQVNGGNYRGCIGYEWHERMRCSIWKEYSEPPISNSEIRLHMTDGENCFTGTDRETELIISCDDSLDKMLSVSAVNEVQTCRYVIEASSPLVCKIPVPEATISMSVEMGDEVGVRRSNAFSEQGHITASKDVETTTGESPSTPKDIASTLNEIPSTPHAVSPDENPTTPSESTPNENPSIPQESSTTPEPKEPLSSPNSLQNRSHFDQLQP